MLMGLDLVLSHAERECDLYLLLTARIDRAWRIQRSTIRVARRQLCIQRIRSRKQEVQSERDERFRFLRLKVIVGEWTIDRPSGSSISNVSVVDTTTTYQYARQVRRTSGVA